MKKGKTIIAAGVLLCVFLIGGAIAYFTDTKTTTNTFTIGNVAITLTEPGWTEGTSGQDMVPGQSVTKDPTVAVNTGSKDAYLFVKVEVPCTGNVELFTFTPNAGWTVVEDNACASGVASKVYGYGSSTAMTAVAAGASQTLFNSVTLANINSTQASAVSNAASMPITAYGIQADGLANSNPTTVWGYVNS